MPGQTTAANTTSANPTSASPAETASITPLTFALLKYVVISLAINNTLAGISGIHVRTASATQINFPRVVRKALSAYADAQLAHALTIPRQQLAKAMAELTVVFGGSVSIIFTVTSLLMSDPLTTLSSTEIRHATHPIIRHLGQQTRLAARKVDTQITNLSHRTVVEEGSAMLEKKILEAMLLPGQNQFFINVKNFATRFLQPLLQRWENSHAISPKRQLVSAEQVRHANTLYQIADAFRQLLPVLCCMKIMSDPSLKMRFAQMFVAKAGITSVLGSDAKSPNVERATRRIMADIFQGEYDRTPFDPNSLTAIQSVD